MTLNPRQFSHDEVKSAVEAYEPASVERGSAHPLHSSDTYTRRVVPLAAVHGPDKKPVVDRAVGRDQRGTVSEYKRVMKQKGGSAKFPPIVVAQGATPGHYDWLDGSHRILAAHAAGITHGVAFVRDRPASYIKRFGDADWGKP